MPGFKLFSFSTRKGKGKETAQSPTNATQASWKEAESSMEAGSHPGLVAGGISAPPPPYLPSDYAPVPPPEVMKDLSAYNGGSQADRAQYLNKPMREDTQEHVLDLLRRYDTVIILDDSDSMKRHWAEARHALSKLAGLATKRDTDGIDIYFINHEIPLLGVKSEAQVEKAMEAIKPRGSTYLGEALDNVLRPYLLKLEQAYARDGEDALKSIKPINFIIITDGMPADTPEDAIIQAARRLDSKEFPLSQVGVSFVQIGNDKEGAEYLQMLDDALEGTRDMVDTTPYFGPVTTDALCKILLGGINRRWDKANPDGSKKRRK